MLPAPTTIATSTPWSRTSVTCRATAATRLGSSPYSSDPISASPESFRRIRLKAGAEAISGRAYSPGRLLTHCETGEAADDYVLPRRGGQLVAQLLDGLALELRVVHLLLEQGDRPQPRVKLAGDDLLPHVLRLLGGFLLIDTRLRIANLRGDFLPADVFQAPRGGR